MVWLGPLLFLLVFSLAERNRFRNRGKRAASLVDGLSRLPGGVAQALQIANDIVQPRLCRIKQTVSPLRQEQESEPCADGCARNDFRKLRLIIHSNLLRAASPANGSDDASALNQLHEQRNDREHQEHVNKSTERVRAHDSKHPQHNENEEDCPEHVHPSTKVLRR